jgi:hypothetical protein
MQDEIHADNFSRDLLALYHLQGDDVDWQTGFTRDGDQLLVIRMFPDVLAIRFTHNGKLDRIVSVPGFPSSSLGFFSEQNEEALREWLSQVGFRPGLIRVRRFFLSEHHVGISDLSSYFQNILLSPSKYSQDERAFAQRELFRWSKEGIFELSLGEHNDLWIGKNGQIIAS